MFMHEASVYNTTGGRATALPVHAFAEEPLSSEDEEDDEDYNRARPGDFCSPENPSFHDVPHSSSPRNSSNNNKGNNKKGSKIMSFLRLKGRKKKHQQPLISREELERTTTDNNFGYDHHHHHDARTSSTTPHSRPPAAPFSHQPEQLRTAADNNVKTTLPPPIAPEEQNSMWDNHDATAVPVQQQEEERSGPYAPNYYLNQQNMFASSTSSPPHSGVLAPFAADVLKPDEITEIQDQCDVPFLREGDQRQRVVGEDCVIAATAAAAASAPPAELSSGQEDADDWEAIPAVVGQPVDGLILGSADAGRRDNDDSSIPDPDDPPEDGDWEKVGKDSAKEMETSELLGAFVGVGVVGLLMVGPITGAILGAGAVYAAYQDDGKQKRLGPQAARAAGRVALTARDKAMDLNEKHQIWERSKTAAGTAWNVCSTRTKDYVAPKLSDLSESVKQSVRRMMTTRERPILSFQALYRRGVGDQTLVHGAANEPVRGHELELQPVLY